MAWFDERAGLELDAATGESRARHPGLRMYAASRFDDHELHYGRQLELRRERSVRHRWRRESFALLACAFSRELCAVSESSAPARAFDLKTGELAWTYRPRDGAHLTQLDFAPPLDCFVALEYAYTDEARRAGPMVALLHLDRAGTVVFRQAIREWSDAVFCADGALLVNGLGELYDAATGTVRHVFDFPR
jgi:hypothetical protein